MKTDVVRYEADGLAMVGHLAWDETAQTKRPGVLVFPEAFGLGPHAKSRAERLASELGYVALACDLHGEQRIIGDLDAVRATLQPLRSDAARVRARARNALDALTRQPQVDATRVAAMGYCFG